MCIDGLWRTFTNQKYRVLYVTPYENQVRLIFIRLRELIEGSPLLKAEIVKFTQNPYQIKFRNGSMIMGFTTGAASGSGGASIRGQRADYIYIDEVDYLGEGDFDTVAMIAGERSDIGMFISSTPTGKRGKFYEACTNKAMGYTEHYHPSMHNPNWCDQMEAEFRAQLTEQGYTHEVLAEFGTQQAGVFPKVKVDGACMHDCYAYEELSYIQSNRVKEQGIIPAMYLFDVTRKAPPNPFRTMGIDWDKYGASSSIVILDFDIIKGKFRVIKRVEVPRSEYSYDTAVNLVVQLNEIYRPSWIYADRGSGEYQIERLHMIGDQRPQTNLKVKVKGWQFSQTLEVIDPVTKEKTKEPMKPFMVNQLCIAFERDRMILSPFDEVLHKQLIDYEVERISASGVPVFTSKEEHFVDALGLAYLAFVLEFPDIARTVKQPEFTSKIEFTQAQLGQSRVNAALRQISLPTPARRPALRNDGDLRGDRPTWVKVPLGSGSGASRSPSWGSRLGGGGGGRSLW